MRKITLLFLVICLSACIQAIYSENRNTPPPGIVFRNVLNYSTSGQKLRTIYQTSVTATSTSQTPYDEYTTVAGRDYCDDVIYLNGAIEMVRTPNGYITPQGEYRISVKDNQGNVRLVTDLSGNVIERNDYYPYGSLFSENDIAQPYKYSGKEFENRNGLNIYDFHARYFDYAIPCFTTQDPLQEKYYQISPYTYCSGDPMNKIDPSGKYVESVWDAVNIGLGISSLWNNIQDGNVADAVVDGLGIAVDVVAIILPGVPGGAGTAIKSIRVADNVVDAAKISKNVPKFNSKSSTTSKTSNEALRKAKDQNGIPRSQQPDKTIKVGTPEGDDANLKANENIQLYEYTNSNGERIQIRQDKAKIYKDGGTQLPHYNAGKKDEKLKQHHNYGN